MIKFLQKNELIKKLIYLIKIKFLKTSIFFNAQIPIFQYALFVNDFSKPLSNKRKNKNIFLFFNP